MTNEEMNVSMKKGVVPLCAENNSNCISNLENFESNARTYSRKFPIAIKWAKGCRLEDVEGEKYLDMLCGAGSLALGHNDDEINAAMIEMINSNAPLHTLDLTTPTKDAFIKKVINLLPKSMQNNVKIQFCSPAGSDATDAALKLCKTATGNSSIISFGGAYHGMGQGPLSLTGNLNAKNSVNSLLGDVHFFPYPYSYRCPFGLGGDAGVDAACAYFERTLKDPESGISKIAAVILEPIQGEGGVIPAPKKFLQTVRRVTKELGIPMIVDEIQCGCGRSGDFFAFQYADIEPDVILISKAIGGSQPLAIVVYNKELDKWTPGAHAGTFRGNQLAMRAGMVVMDRVNTPEFLAEVKAKGERIKNAMLALKDKVSIIGDIRGRGLMIGCEFIDSNGEKDMLGSYPASGDIAARVQNECFKRKVIIERGGRNGAVLRCLCPLNIGNDDIDEMLAVLSEVVLQENKNAHC